MKASPAHLAYAAAAFLTTLVLVAPAAAATSAEERTPLNLENAEEPAKQAASGGGGIARMVVGLAVVIGVIYGLAWVLRQVKAAKEGSATGGQLEQLSSLPLGPNRAVHLVRAGHDFVLLGVAEKGVTPIRTYTEAEARAAGLLADDDHLLPAGPVNGGGTSPATASNLLEALRQRTVRR